MFNLPLLRYGHLSYGIPLYITILNVLCWSDDLYLITINSSLLSSLCSGLLLPKIVVDDFGGTRSDPGMLGSGIYFAGSSSLSCKYSKPGTRGKHTRLMLVNQVALGSCKVCFVYVFSRKNRGDEEGISLGGIFIKGFYCRGAWY